MSKQVQITLSYRFLERLIYILIILVLVFLLVSKYRADSKACELIGETDDKAPTTTPGMDDNKTDVNKTKDTVKNETDEETPPPEPEPEPEPEEDEEDEPQTQLSGKITATIGNIDWEIQEDGRARINNIKVRLQNGLEEDVKLFATIYLTESGNEDLEAVNPFWDKVEVPLLESGDNQLVTLEPSKSWPPGVKDGDDLLIEGEFEDLQGTIEVSDQDSQEV